MNLLAILAICLALSCIAVVGLVLLDMWRER